MKGLPLFFIAWIPSTAFSASEVISCGDAMAVGVEAKLALHQQAQQRAQVEIEEFQGRKLVVRYINALGSEGDIDSMASVIEVFWCETADTPLHDAYYRLYSRNMRLFEGEGINR